MKPQIIGILNKNNFSEIISESSTKEDLYELSLCHVLEFRGDTFLPDEIIEKLLHLGTTFAENNLKKPKLLFTLRLTADGGQWMSDPETRLNLWEKCLDANLIDWIDIELEQIERSAEILKRVHHSTKVNLLLSHHNFHSSYSSEVFAQKLATMDLYAPDIVKFAVTLQSREDLLEMLTFSQKLSLSHPLSCCISMGEWGKISRLASPLMGAPLTYGFLGGVEVVPGQISVKNLFKYHNLLSETLPETCGAEEATTFIENHIADEAL